MCPQNSYPSGLASRPLLFWVPIRRKVLSGQPSTAAKRLGCRALLRHSASGERRHGRNATHRAPPVAAPRSTGSCRQGSGLAQRISTGKRWHAQLPILLCLVWASVSLEATGRHQYARPVPVPFLQQADLPRGVSRGGAELSCGLRLVSLGTYFASTLAAFNRLPKHITKA